MLDPGEGGWWFRLDDRLEFVCAAEKDTGKKKRVRCKLAVESLHGIVLEY